MADRLTVPTLTLRKNSGPKMGTLLLPTDNCLAQSLGVQAAGTEVKSNRLCDIDCLHFCVRGALRRHGDGCPRDEG